MAMTLEEDQTHTSLPPTEELGQGKLGEYFWAGSEHKAKAAWQGRSVKADYGRPAAAILVVLVLSCRADCPRPRP